MQKADEKEDHHPAVKRTEFSFGVLQLDGEAHPEKDGEERVELSIHKEGQEGLQHPVIRRMRSRIGKGPQRKLREVRQDNTQNGKAAKGVQYDVSFLFQIGSLVSPDKMHC